MKYAVAFLVAFLAIFFLQTDAAVDETEVISMRDTNNPVVRSESQVERDLEEANLESVGFTKSRRSVVEIVNGEKHKRKFIKYSVRDKCSEEKKWRRHLEQRLPKHFFSNELNQDFDKEVKNKKPLVPKRYCDFELEIELRPKGRKRFFSIRSVQIGISFG